MNVEFGAPSALWLIAALPAIWFAGRLVGAGRARPQHVVLRGAVLTCLVAALADPILLRPASRVAMVYLVDVSHSISTQAIASAAEAIDAMTAALRPDESRILAFATRTTSVRNTAALRGIGADTTREAIDALVAADGTNLEQALAAARAEIPPSANGRIVVFSDGRETEGQSSRAAERLAADRVPVFAQPLDVRDLGDTWIAAVRPAGVPVENAVSTIDVVVASQTGGEVAVAVAEAGTVLARRQATVEIGTTTVPIDVMFTSPGAHLVDASVSNPGDTLGVNNVLASEIVVEPRTRVLFVGADSSDLAPVALLRAGAAVTRARPAELPRTAAGLSPWDVVVLSNVPRAAIAVDAMAAIGSWVEERGGGLLFAGGGAVVGETPDNPDGGYRRTELERVLPVTFDREDEPEVALVIVLDRSWSMNGTAMELSKRAAEAAAMTLAPEQVVGVLTFNNAFEWDVPLSRVRESRASLHDRIARITASGPTAIYPALQEAYAALRGVRARAKHIILLSDGQTAPEDFEGLLKQMSAASMTVSSVALGPEADVTLLRNLATWGGGRNYAVQDAQQIPEIFVKEARGAATPGYDDDATITTVVRQPQMFAGVSRVPGVLGRNTVTRRPQAIDLLATSQGDPLLVLWPAGLGRTAMLAVDLDGRWTREWARWPELGSFLSTVVRALAARRPPAWSLAVVPGDGPREARTLTVTLDAREGDGRRANLLSPRVTVTGAAGQRAVVELAQVAPGRYEARTVADLGAPLRFVMDTPAAARASRILVTDAAAEYRLAEPDEANLGDVARMTGGTFRPTVEDVRRAPRSAGAVRHALAPWLLGLALMGWIGDIAARRLWR